LSKLDKAELSKEFFELQALKLQHEKMEASYREIFPKVCSNLIHDLLLRLRQDPQNPPLYTVEVFTKAGTDSRMCKDHILATTGTTPAIYDHGTHYVTHMRLTLEIIKKLNDFEYVLEVMGDYTDSDASLGPMHNIGDAHRAITHVHPGLQRGKEEPEKSSPAKKGGVLSNNKNTRTIVYTLIAFVGVIALAGFILSGGLLPNVNKSTAPVPPFQISDLAMISGHVTGPAGLPAIGASIIAHKIQGLPGTDQRLADYTTNSVVSIDGKYVFNLPVGVYRFTVAFPDGTNQIVNTYAVWPGSVHSLDFKY
jgi:hypothetical protein